MNQKILDMNLPWMELLSTLGRGSYQYPVTPYGQTAQKANSGPPSTASLSNTVPSYSTYGGQFVFAAPAGAVTDFALFAWQAPKGYQHLLTGVRIACLIQGAAMSITPSILEWSLGVNSSSASLATADGAGTWGPRRIPLGMQSWLATAIEGTGVADINQRFDPPLLVSSERYLHVIVQIPRGTATGSLVFRGVVLLTGVNR